MLICPVAGRCDVGILHLQRVFGQAGIGSPLCLDSDSDSQEILLDVGQYANPGSNCPDQM